jgi:hypothetical protein
MLVARSSCESSTVDGIGKCSADLRARIQAARVLTVAAKRYFLRPSRFASHAAADCPVDCTSEHLLAGA